MDLQLYTWRIVGTRPLMQHNPAGSMSRAETTTKSNVVKAKSYGTARDEAQAGLYVTDDGLYYHPANAFRTLMLSAATGRKIGKMTMKNYVAAAIDTPEEEFLLLNPDTLDPLTDDEWHVDLRRVVIPSNKAAILRARPKWLRWGGLLTLELDLEWGPLDHATDLLNIGGRMCGLGSGRPEINSQKKLSGGLTFGKFKADLYDPKPAKKSTKVKR